MNYPKPKIFYHQDPKNLQCTLYALNNVLQKEEAEYVTCKEFQQIVKKLQNIFTFIMSNNALKSEKTPDKCGCHQDSWSLSVPLKYLKENNINYEEFNKNSVPKNEEFRELFKKGHYYVFVKLNKYKHNNHALCIINGWLLDSLQDGPEKIIDNNMFIERYSLQEYWKLNIGTKI
jgi:hypothetical protein